MARTAKQRAAGKSLVKREAELHQAIGYFIFWFSQLEFTIKARLAGALQLEDGLFDIVIGPYDYAMLCKVTEEVLCKDAAPEAAKRIRDYFSRCQRLNQQARLIVAHASWTLDGARHVSRNSLKAGFHFQKPQELRNQGDTARRLMSELITLDASPR